MCQTCMFVAFLNAGDMCICIYVSTPYTYSNNGKLIYTLSLYSMCILDEMVNPSTLGMLASTKVYQIQHSVQVISPSHP
jgi:hypothetical protein